MSLPETIGIESHLGAFATHLFEFGAIRAKFRAPDPSFPTGDWIDVKVVARVYDREEVERQGALPDAPLAEGCEVTGTARSEWRVIDLPLPSVPLDHYTVVAKVYSADQRYRKLFNPSNCYASIVSFGQVIRMKLNDLRQVYAPMVSKFENPLAEAEIKRLVRGGGVVVEEHGVLFAAREVDGKLHLTALQA